MVDSTKAPERYASELLDTLEGAGLVVDAGGIVLFANAGLTHLLGYPPGELQGRPLEKLIPQGLRPGHAAHMSEYFKRPRSRPKGVGVSLSALRKDGSEIPVEISLTPIDADGACLVLASLRSISPQEVWYRTMFERLAVGVVHSDSEGAFLAVNDRFCKLLDYTHAEALTLDIRRVTHPDDIAACIAARARAVAELASGYEQDVRLIGKSAAVIWVHIVTSAVPQADAATVQFISLVQDISAQKHAEEERARLAAIVESSGDAIVGKTLEGIITSWNAGACKLFGYDAEEAIGRPIALVIPPDRMPEEQQILERLRRGERVAHIETVRKRKDGALIDVSLTISPILDAQRRVIGASKIARDITERKRADLKIRHLNRVYAVLSSINALIVRVRSQDELFREACRIATEAGKFRLAWIGVVDRAAKRLRIVAWSGADEEFVKRIPVGLEDVGSPKRGLANCAVAEGRPVISNDMAHDPRILLQAESAQLGLRSVAHIPLLVAGEVVAVLALQATEADFFDEVEMRLLQELAGDIAFAIEHIEKAARADYLAYYDQLTALANRTLFIERLSQFMLAAKSASTGLALVLFDVERFSAVNDSFGRQAGDALLKLLAERLSQHAGPSRSARIAGDVFALVMPELSDRCGLERAIAGIWTGIFDSPFQTGGTSLKVSARRGIAVFPADGAGAEALLSHAEMALRRAKETGDSSVFHTPEFAARSAERLTLESRLRQALEKEEFVLHYQPKLELRTRQIVGVEALMRWQCPDLGLVPPAKFIRILEDTGLILQVGAWVLSRAVRDYHRWVERGIAAPRVAVNVSPVQLHSRDFVEQVTSALGAGADSPEIDLEITESLLMADVEENVRKLKLLRERGIAIAIDDFGTGYSSLSYLTKLPVHALKIDRSFISAMSDDPDTMSLVQTVISLAHSLNLRVIAEGVETEEQSKLLRLLRCDEVQGYLFGRPVPFEAITAVLANSRSEHLPARS